MGLLTHCRPMTPTASHCRPLSPTAAHCLPLPNPISEPNAMLPFYSLPFYSLPSHLMADNAGNFLIKTHSPSEPNSQDAKNKYSDTHQQFQTPLGQTGKPNPGCPTRYPSSEHTFQFRMINAPKNCFDLFLFVVVLFCLVFFPK